jgi:hypothetical protein
VNVICRSILQIGYCLEIKILFGPVVLVEAVKRQIKYLSF